MGRERVLRATAAVGLADRLDEGRMPLLGDELPWVATGEREPFDGQDVFQRHVGLAVPAPSRCNSMANGDAANSLTSAKSPLRSPARRSSDRKAIVELFALEGELRSPARCASAQASSIRQDELNPDRLLAGTADGPEPGAALRLEPPGRELLLEEPHPASARTTPGCLLGARAGGPFPAA